MHGNSNIKFIIYFLKMTAVPCSKFTFSCLAIKRSLAQGTPRSAAEQVVVVGTSALVCTDCNYRRVIWTAYRNESNVAHNSALTSR